jgi:hypothetical protein
MQDLRPQGRKQIPMSDIKNRLCKTFAERVGYKPDLDNPRTFNEKILHRKLYDRNLLFPMTCDKVASREWARSKIGSKYIMPYEAHEPGDPWKNTSPIIAKHTAASGRNKMLPYGGTHHDIPARWWATVYGQSKAEWGYSMVKPRVLVEPLIEPAPEVYRFDVFHAEVLAIQIYTYSQDHKLKDITTYTRQFNRVEVSYNNKPIGWTTLAKNIGEMIDVAETLGKSFDYIRVDLMLTAEGGLVFSELTPYPMSGSGLIHPRSWDEYLGGAWDYRPNLIVR